MKNILFTLLALTTSVFSQGVKEDAKSLYYMTMGTEIPLAKFYDLSSSDRAFSTIGMGVRDYISPEHALEVCLTLMYHPVVRQNEMSIGYIYRPIELLGIYVGANGYYRDSMNAWFDKFQQYGFRGAIGYQVPSEDKSSFVEIGFDNSKNLSIRSGLLF